MEKFLEVVEITLGSLAMFTVALVILVGCFSAFGVLTSTSFLVNLLIAFVATTGLVWLFRLFLTLVAYRLHKIN